MTIRLLLVDDHAVVRSGLKMLLENEHDVEIIGEAASASEAIEATLRPAELPEPIHHYLSPRKRISYFVD